jgi:outer membrane receptor for ferrienterochelin and colicin
MQIHKIVKQESPVHKAATFAALAAAAYATLGTVTAVYAAGETEDVALETVIVTGSRIAVPNQTSTSPILTVSSDEIKSEGRLDITDMLNLLPQINSNSLGQDLGNKTSGLTSAGGVATADLRGLGPNRTLVLVDGRRLGNGSPQTVIASPAPDLAQARWLTAWTSLPAVLRRFTDRMLSPVS